MAAGPNKKTEETLAIIEGIYDAALDPAGWDRVVAALQRRLRSPLAGIFTQDAVTSAFSADLLRMEEKYHRLYVEHIAPVNPWIRVPGLMRPGRVLTDQSIEIHHRDSKAYVETAFHQDFARPQGFRHTMGGTLFTHGHKLVNFTYFRPAAEGPYTRSEIHLHKLLARHIARALGMSRKLEALGRELSVSSYLIDQLAFGVIQFDSKGRIRAANREARRLLASGDGLAAPGGRLSAQRPTEDRRLKALIRSVTSAEAIARELPPDQVILSRPSGKMALSVVAMPVPRERTILDGETGAALLLVSDPERRPILETGYLAERFGFSRSEARLAAALAQGYVLRRAAEISGLSYETARWYLKAMFEKTGAHRQAELVHLLLADLAMMATADPLH